MVKIYIGFANGLRFHDKAVDDLNKMARKKRLDSDSDSSFSSDEEEKIKRKPVKKRPPSPVKSPPELKRKQSKPNTVVKFNKNVSKDARKTVEQVHTSSDEENEFC
ncbi:hypothetical protein KIN20_005496 [Parelaphostrongylus tenuis]|uniref:Uncharacterized protein n=1 Tax=Parelaphostrongylus tenuis TaxID=148309 RepID=A0AAD5QIM2_PARTN|nr:hypothetical protein KIN20_005496 [Parelaphostrongylus tenuis]